jgi:hypothetical protein
MAQEIQLPIVFKFIRLPIRWAIHTSRIGTTSLVGTPLESKEQQIDGWECRREFLKLPEDDHELCRFMNKVGMWDRYTGELPKTIDLWPRRVWELRKDLKDELELKSFSTEFANPDSSLGSILIPHLSFRFKLNSQVATGVVTITSFWEMLLTTIYVDFARGFSFARCQRQDCNGDKVFVVETAHKRKFCSQYCGHLVSMRKKRRAAEKKTRSRGR